MKKELIEKRMQVLLTFVIAIFLILVARLVYMQLIQNDKFTTLARENWMRLINITAPRGEIFDRNGIKLVGNQPVYNVTLLNMGRKPSADVVQKLASILGMSPQDIQQKVDVQKLSYEPVQIATRVAPEIVTQIEEQKMELPGVSIDIEPQREYPFETMLAQVFGYVREINPQQLEENKDKGYASGDPYGQTGLENTYEQYLRGQDGGRQVEVDSMGRPVRDVGVKAPVPGDNLVLTIDEKVQKAAEDALARVTQQAIAQGHSEARAGAAVALDVRSGGVLAMASYPTFDPAKLSGNLTQKDTDDIFNNPWKPLLNRVLMPYAPGSTFKMIVAMAGLLSGTITPDYAISDPGYFFLGRRFNDDVPGGHGMVNLARAIKVSCDTYFYQLGFKMGIDEIAKVAREFGLGEKTGIDLPGEESGVIPGPDTKADQRLVYLSAANKKKVNDIMQKYNDLLAKANDENQRKKLLTQRGSELESINWDLNWHDYDTIISAIGQGDNRYTPLELANYVATIANGGTRYKPYLLQKVVDPDGKVVKENGPEVLGHVDVPPNILALIRDDMHGVTQAPDGTAFGLFNADGFPPVAAKTGTAEVQGHDSNSLLVAFAPVDNPQIAVAVVVEHAGWGASFAGPVAEDMLAAYFGLPIPGKTAAGSAQ